MLGSIIAGGASLIGGALAGNAADKQAEAMANANAPWNPTRPHIDTIMNTGKDWFEQAKETGYINPDGSINETYFQYLDAIQNSQGQTSDAFNQLFGQGMNQMSNAGAGLNSAQGFYDNVMAGGGALTPDKILADAESYMDSDLLDAQIQAATRDDVRNLTENALPTIDRNAVGAGNMGSSRAGVQAAVAERATNERIADTSANIRSSAYQDALNKAVNVNQNNMANQMNAAGGNINASNAMFNQGNTMFGNAGNVGNTVMSQYAPMLEAAQLQQMMDAFNNKNAIGERDYLLNLAQQYGGIIDPYTGFSNGSYAGGGNNFQGAAGNALMQGGLGYLGNIIGNM